MHSDQVMSILNLFRKKETPMHPQTPKEYMQQAHEFMQNLPADAIITIEDIRKDKKKKYFLLDVRYIEEVAGGKIPDTVPIPLHELDKRIDELPEDRQIVTVCAHGTRSAAALLFLKDNGFKDVKMLQGGTIAWIEAGYELEDYTR